MWQRRITVKLHANANAFAAPKAWSVTVFALGLGRGEIESGVTSWYMADHETSIGAERFRMCKVDRAFPALPEMMEDSCVAFYVGKVLMPANAGLIAATLDVSDGSFMLSASPTAVVDPEVQNCMSLKSSSNPMVCVRQTRASRSGAG